MIALLAIAGFTILFKFMKGKNLFTTENIFYSKFNDVEGLEPSNSVTINGMKIGQVDKIIPQRTKDGLLYFVVKITADERYEFSKNSSLEIFEQGLMGGKQAKINMVYDGAPIAKDGDTLKGTFKISMINSLSSQIMPVKDQMQNVLKRIDSLSNNANKILNEQNRAEIKALLSSLNKTVSSFENTSKQTNLLLAHNDPKIQKVLDNANLATQSAKSAIDKYGNVADNIDTQKLNNAVEKLSVTADKLNYIISGIQNGQGSLGKLTKDEELYNNLNKTSQSLNSLILDLKENPKRYINISVFGKDNKN